MSERARVVLRLGLRIFFIFFACLRLLPSSFRHFFPRPPSEKSNRRRRRADVDAEMWVTRAIGFEPGDLVGLVGRAGGFRAPFPTGGVLNVSRVWNLEVKFRAKWFVFILTFEIFHFLIVNA